ncbi:MAG: protein kinase, partial [Planctomycetes bacterium]|nr:protein kinase [Planctomycetota bacterium]
YPLDEYLTKKGNPRLSSSLRIMRETALGLAAAHKLGFIHRDIKPANIWLEAPNGRVKILDFGLAKALESNDANELTRTGMIMGTPAYMAPEQGMGNKVDARTDLFSLGCVLYRLATGKLPFDKPTLMGTLAAIATEDPTPAEQLNPEVRTELGDLIRRMLAKKPENRPSDADEVAQELERILALGKTTIEKIDSEPNQEPPVDSAALYPMEVTAPPNSSIIGNTSISPKPQAVLPPKKPRNFWLPAIGLAMFGAFGLVFAQVIIKIKNKDGSETEIKVPEGAAVEVTQNNTTVTIGPNQSQNATNRPALNNGESIANTNSTRALSNDKKVDPSIETIAKRDTLEPAKSPYVWNPMALGSSPLDKLDPSAIPVEERFDFQPDEIVAVIGSHTQRHWGPCVAVALNAAETRAATSSTNGEVIVWDLGTLKPLKRFRPDRGAYRNPYRMRFAENDNQLELLSRSNIFYSVWDISDEPEMIHSSSTSSLYAMSASAWLERGKTLMLDLSENREFALIQLSDGGFEERARVKLEPYQVRSNVMAATDVNQVFYVAPGMKLHRATVKEAQLTNDEELPIPLLPGDPSIRGLSPDGKLLAIRDDQGTVCWDLTDNPPKVRWREREGGYYEASLSPCGRWVAIGGDYGLNLYQATPEGLTLVKKIDEQTYQQGSMVFSKDGNRAILAGGNGFVRVWDLSASSPKEIVPFDPTTAFIPPTRESAVGFTALASSDGQLVLSPSNFGHGPVARGQLWDLTGTVPKPLAYLTPPASALFFTAGKDRVITMHTYSNEPPRVHPLREGRFSSKTNQYSVGNSFGMISPDGRTAVHYFPLAEGQKTFEGWDIAGDKPQKKWSIAAQDFINPNPISGNGSPRIWLSADNRWIATQGQQDPPGGPWKLT